MSGVPRLFPSFTIPFFTARLNFTGHRAVLHVLSGRIEFRGHFDRRGHVDPPLPFSALRFRAPGSDRNLLQVDVFDTPGEEKPSLAPVWSL